jgi:aminomethyltransferase
MQASAKDSLLHTPLRDWHAAHGARMVGFGGWSMPLHYAAGAVREHVATRTQAGLFDVSHMGRFRIAGHGAQAFLARVLTADVAALAPQRAQYTFIADEHGAAIDDAYLYCLEQDEYLLVVNAANRLRDRDWLHTANPPADAHIEDRSEPVAMLALQGPRSQMLLAAALDGGELPQARNRLSRVSHGGHRCIVARTGYTGEAVGFELFVPAPQVEALWQRLVEAGAHPAGLAARDSLRLEAGLPLYGHELGSDRNGEPIPIFANRLARFGVRLPGRGHYIGVRALDAQRLEYEDLLAGRIAATQARLLPRLVQPLAAFGERRPLRSGYDLLLQERCVGYVTSGTSVPVPATDASVRTMRPIGLALLDAGVRFGSSPQRELQARDGRGNSWRCELVERNLPPPPGGTG